MACNRETSADGTTSSSTPPACQNSDSLVPCCNTNCHSLGCAATMNLCSKCYSEHILEEGGAVFLTKPCDASVHLSTVRQNADAAEDAANNSCGGGVNGSSAQRIEDVPALSSRSMGESMSRSVGIADLHAVYRSALTEPVGNMSGSMASDFPEQRMPSPLSLPSSSAQVGKIGFSSVQEKAHETKLSLPPLPASRQQAVSRCLTCRKRVGLLGFKCRCGDIFCSLHRYSDRHDCSFDYKAAGRAAIAKENPLVKAIKIEKI